MRNLLCLNVLAIVSLFIIASCVSWHNGSTVAASTRKLQPVVSTLAVSQHVSVTSTAVPPARAHDVTTEVERLGMPSTKGPYARNIWDMQLFAGRIYLGHGNSSNVGPEPNAGPIPIWYYDLATGRFIKEGTVDEEQIDSYRILDGKLYIPGHDPRGDTPRGDLYQLNTNGWAKVNTLPDAVHTYDVALFDGHLFAAIGTLASHRILVSDDMGQTWRTAMADSGRTYSLFAFKQQLYAVSFILNRPDPSDSEIDRYNGKQFVHGPIAGSSIIPEASSDTDAEMRFVRTTNFANQLLYIAAETINDHQWTPKGFYVTSDMQHGQHIVLSEPTAIPYDIVVRGDTAYLLASVKRSAGTYTNLVYASRDAQHWSEQFRFNTSTFARSFEESNGDFYFGLGSDTDPLASASGDILRVRRVAYAPNASAKR